MKFTQRIRPFSVPPRLRFLSFCLVVPLASCSSLDLAQVAPRADGRPTAAAQSRQPDGYPGFEIPPGAASQLDDAESRALAEELTSLRLRQAVRAGKLSEAERLRILARMHAEERLKQIEAGGE